MLIGREQFDSVYAMLKEAAAQTAGNACSIVVFVASDCDAACACRALTNLLKGDNIQFKVQPVSGYSDVTEATRGLEEEIRSIVMLNCGAGIDLGDLFALEENKANNVFVIDHHRPIHLKNVHAERVFVLDAEASMEDVPSDGDDDDESSSDEEEEERPTLDEPVDDDDEEEEEATTKRARRADAEREARRQKRRRVRAYYDGNYDGMPSSLLIFSMSDAMSRATPTDLWLAAVGLSSLDEHGRLGEDHYDAFIGFLAQHLRQMETSRDVRTTTGLVETGRVTFEADEPRFMLHRHWGLLWSMYYSNYVASRLSVWRRDGTSKLNELLAKMGLSIEQSQQRWSFLSPSQRRKLKENLPKYASEYKLDEPFRPAFLRVTGCGGEQVTASDAAACVEAVLEASLAKIAFQEEEENGDEEDEDAATNRLEAREKAAWVSGFWRAYDATLVDDADLFESAVDSAIALQKAIVSVAVQMIDKREITTLKHFRYVYLNANQTSNQLFTQPLAVRKLALFLLGVHRQSGKWTGDKAKPIVILAERPGTWIVVGVQQERSRKNRFGHSFRFAADHIKANFRHDWFDAAVMEVSQADVQRFVESLHYVLSC